MAAIAIIPARGGSKRLPRKNVLEFFGKPMLLWTCEAARDSGVFERIIVSTEEEEIAAIVRRAGFEVDMRPQAMAQDNVGVNPVCRELLLRLSAQNCNYERMAALYAPAPLRTAEDIRQTMALMDLPDTDFAWAATEYEISPYYAFYTDSDGYIAPASALLSDLAPSLPKALVDNGSTYIARTETFLRQMRFNGPRTRAYIMPRIRSVDLNTPEDLEFLTLYARHLNFPACLEGQKP